MCTHFRSYLRGPQFTLRTDHSSLRWLQKFHNGVGMLARWYMLLGQFSVTFEYRPGAQHANVDGMSSQCGQCQRPDCPVSSSDSRVTDVDATTVLLDQPFASSEMGDSMDADLLPELSGETWLVATLLEGLTADLPPAGSDLDLIAASRQDATLTTVREWVQSGAAPACLNVRGCHQSCGVGGCRSAICQWRWRGDCGVAGLLHRGLSACGARPPASGYASPIS